METLSIRLLGGLTVEIDGKEHTSEFSGRMRSLLAWLLLTSNLPQSRQSIAFSFWPESTDKQARTNLRKLVLLLRGALGPAAPYLVVTDDSLCWRMDEHVWLDTHAFTTTLAAAKEARSDKAAVLLSQAVDLYRGDLLPDCFDEWLITARETLRDSAINALEELCGLLETEGRYADGVAMARRLLQIDPIYERGHLHLVRLQALMNDRAAALQSYHRCATLLRRELGIDPSPALEELYLQLLDHNLPTPAASTSEEAASIPLIGRGSAWQQLVKRWQQVQRGQAHFVLIVGEAGIGKSRLAEEIMLWVERQGNVTAHARAYSSDNRTLTYAPIAELMRVPTIRSEIAQLKPYWLTEIARLLPELLLERSDIRPPQPMVDDWQRHHLFAALTQALQPKRRARLLVIDDLQWADSETLAWLPHLLDHAKNERLLVVGTVRSEEFDDYETLQTMCETLRRRGQLEEILLGPLSIQGISELAEYVTGEALTERQAQCLAGTTEGNPLFVIETARLLQDEGAAADLRAAMACGLSTDTPGVVLARLPKSMLAVIDARLARLSKEARTLAEVAATIGRSFTFPVLAAASSLSEDQLVDALDELWRRRIIRERESDAYDFSHDRIRDGAYGSISALRRRLLHKRVAAALIQTHQGSLDEISGQLGYHYEQANERLAAIEQYMLAAKVAGEQYAHQESLYYIDRVLALALPEERALRFEALLRRDRTLEIIGNLSMWKENIQRMRELAEVEGEEPEVLLRRRAIVAARAAHAAPRLHDPAGAVVQAAKAVEYASMTGDARLQASCHHIYGLRLWYIADFTAAIVHLEKAIALARQVGDSETLASALEARAQTYMFNGGTASTISGLLEESLSHYEKIGSQVGRSQILNKLGYLHFAQGTGQYEESRDLLMRCAELARQIDHSSGEVSPQRNLGVLYTCMGNYAEAARAIQRAQEILYSLGETEEDPTLLNYWGFLYLSQGRLADALAAQLKALERLTAHSHQQWRVKALTALAWIHLRLEQPEAAMPYCEMGLANSRAINERRQVAYTLIVRGILLTGRRNFAAARTDFEDARAILHAFEMYNRAQEAEAGLAYLDLLEGKHDTALNRAYAILSHVETHNMDFTEDVCQVLLTCYRIFTAFDPSVLEPSALPRLEKVIAHHFATRTATLDSEPLELFWQIPAHQELRQALLQPSVVTAAF